MLNPAFCADADTLAVDSLALPDGRVLGGRLTAFHDDTLEFVRTGSTVPDHIVRNDIRWIRLANGMMIFGGQSVEQHESTHVRGEAPDSSSVAGGASLVSAWLRIAAGYGSLAMDDVNDDLKATYELLRSEGIPVLPPGKYKGGFYLQGDCTARLGRGLFGLSVSYISSSGEVSYADISGTFSERYQTGTVEILGVAGFTIPVVPDISVMIRGGAGYGFASVVHTGDLSVYDMPEYDLHVRHDVKGGYLAGRVNADVEFLFGSFGLDCGGGYRIAKAGVLRGTVAINGQYAVDQAVLNSQGGEIGFNYSGFTATVGFLIRL